MTALPTAVWPASAATQASVPSPPVPAPLLQVDGLARAYRLPRASWWGPAPRVWALQDVGFSLHAGRSLGVVGESGSGKSTLARLVMALEPPTRGRVLMQGQDLHALRPAALRRARSRFQMVFQDPFSALDPRRSVLQTVSEPLGLLQGADRIEDATGMRTNDPDLLRQRAADALDAVGLRAADLDKLPHEFSGGQRQRIAIARALITRPALIVADEPVSALDVSVQAQVLNLMAELQRSHGVTYLLISHDLAVVDHLCSDVVVLDAGRVVEQGPPERLFTRPAHAVTQRLLAAVPGRD